MTRASDRAYYTKLFNTVEFKKQDAATAGARIRRNAQRYEVVQAATGVPWYFVALLHTMEASGSFRRQILNGQQLHQKTTIRPRGLGPWTDWETSAIFAVRHKELDKHATWDIPEILARLERWNGMGYRNRGLNSDYLWGKSNHDDPGKFVADGRYDPNADTQQVGAGVLLRWLVDRGCVDAPPKHGLIRFDPKGTHICDVAKCYQAWCNGLMATHEDLRHMEPLVVDGWAGSKTSAMHKWLFGRGLQGDPQNKE